MATISGSLDYVSTRPAAVSEVLLRAPESRTRGTGVITTGNDRFPVVDGVVTFTAFAGPAVLSLVCDGRLSESLPIFVSDADQQTLKQVVDAAGLLDDASKSELEALAQQVMGDAESVAVAAGRAEAAAELAELAEADAVAAAGRAESAADRTGDAASRAEAAAEVAGEAADSAGDDANAADVAAGRAESAAELAGQAAGRAETAAGVAGDAAGRAEIAAELAGEAAADASTKAIADKVAELLEGAPEAYDTLREVADALEAHDDAASAMITQIAGKADVKHTHTTAEISDAGEVGRQVLSATSADEARAAIGAGTSSLVLGTTASTAAAGDHTHTTGQISGLDTALAGKAAASHTHATSEITGLDTALAQIPKIQVVDALPEAPESATLYLVREV